MSPNAINTSSRRYRPTRGRRPRGNVHSKTRAEAAQSDGIYLVMYRDDPFSVPDTLAFEVAFRSADGAVERLKDIAKTLTERYRRLGLDEKDIQVRWEGLRSLVIQPIGDGGFRRHFIKRLPLKG